MVRQGYRPTDINPDTGRPFYADCNDCNYDTHRCGGCGSELLHGEPCCLSHAPLPFFGEGGNPTIGGGVGCSCGWAVKIGDPHPDTPAGKPSKRTYKTMKHCWEAYRGHWQP